MFLFSIGIEDVPLIINILCYLERWVTLTSHIHPLLHNKQDVCREQQGVYIYKNMNSSNYTMTNYHTGQLILNIPVAVGRKWFYSIVSCHHQPFLHFQFICDISAQYIGDSGSVNRVTYRKRGERRHELCGLVAVFRHVMDELV